MRDLKRGLDVDVINNQKSGKMNKFSSNIEVFPAVVALLAVYRKFTKEGVDGISMLHTILASGYRSMKPEERIQFCAELEAMGHESKFLPFKTDEEKVKYYAKVKRDEEERKSDTGKRRV